MKFEIIAIPSTDSTNSWVAANRDSLPMPVLVYTRWQRAGRGQRGNSWESEPGKNLLASALFRPAGVEPRAQFCVSEAVALAVTDLLDHYGVEAKVKWPNDIYVDDRKICGILIENAVMPGEILRSIAGIGINLNQERFLSDAPNPVSLTQITGEIYSVPVAAKLLAAALERRLEMIEGEREELHREYMSRLWRGDGEAYLFYDRLRDERIMARIADVAPDGILTLESEDAGLRSFAFKEVEFLLEKGI